MNPTSGGTPVSPCEKAGMRKMLPPLPGLILEDMIMTADTLAPARHLIGSHYVDSVKPYIQALTGEDNIVAPGDLRPRRGYERWIQIDIDGLGRIHDLSIRYLV